MIPSFFLVQSTPCSQYWELEIAELEITETRDIGRFPPPAQIWRVLVKHCVCRRPLQLMTGGSFKPSCRHEAILGAHPIASSIWVKNSLSCSCVWTCAVSWRILTAWASWWIVHASNVSVGRVKGCEIVLSNVLDEPQVQINLNERYFSCILRLLYIGYTCAITATQSPVS